VEQYPHLVQRAVPPVLSWFSVIGGMAREASWSASVFLPAVDLSAAF